jgi:hypothetical protein
VFESRIDVECACPDLRVKGCDFLDELAWRVSGLVASVGIGDPCFAEALDFEVFVGELEADDAPESLCLCERVLRSLCVSGDKDFLSRGFEEIVRGVLDVIYLDHGEVRDCR